MCFIQNVTMLQYCLQEVNIYRIIVSLMVRPIFLKYFFWCDLPLLAVFIIIIVFLPSSSPSYSPSFEVNPGIKLTSKDHGSECEPLTLTTRPGSFPNG
jgi:hypothetical protein